MIRSNSEYREALKQLEAGRRQLAEQDAVLQSLGLKPDEVQRGLAPIVNFQRRLKVDVQRYESLIAGRLSESWDIRDIGILLIEARIARQLSQRALAERLGVHESQVSRDERNAYHGIALERAQQILEVLGVKISLLASIEPAVREAPVPLEMSPSNLHMNYVAPSKQRPKVIISSQDKARRGRGHRPNGVAA